MGCDLVVALGPATVNRHTMLALHLHGGGQAGQALKRFPGGAHAPDETVRTPFVNLPQARQTCTVLGHQPVGAWGLSHGINEHQLAVAHCQWWSKLPGVGPGLQAADLVRLTLERSRGARQGLDLLTDLVTRYGQSRNQQTGGDGIFLIADAREAFVVETAGNYWAWMECQQARALSDVGVIRQDWQRLSPGLAEHAIKQGWWPDDGSKLDFTGTLGVEPADQAGPLRRFGRSTRLLEQQNGAIDPLCLRRLLEEHFEAAVATHGTPGRDDFPRLQASCIADLGTEGVPLTWWSFGPTAAPLYFPVFLAGELPEALRLPGLLAGPLLKLEQYLDDDRHADAMRQGLGRLQARFDQEAEALAVGALAGCDPEKLARDASALMLQHVELFEGECRKLSAGRRRPMGVAAGLD